MPILMPGPEDTIVNETSYKEVRPLHVAVNSGEETVEGWERGGKIPYWEWPAEPSLCIDLKHGRRYLCKGPWGLCPGRGDSMHTGPAVGETWACLWH